MSVSSNQARGRGVSPVVPEPWLTKPEVAAKLRVSVRTVERLRLPFMRVGNQNRYWMSQVYAALNGVPEEAENVIQLRPSVKGRAA